MDPVIDIKGLCLAYEQHGIVTEILHSLDLTIERGEFLAIVGASGVGKSTLLRVLIGLAAPSAGTVEVFADKTSERAMALVFQDARLLPWRRVISNVAFGLEKTELTKAQRNEQIMDVLENVGLKTLARRYPLIAKVALGLTKYRLTKAYRNKRALAVLKSVGLEALAQRYPHQLSGGQRQRVALARALAVNPSIMLMDEPFSALDALTREALQDEMIRVWTAFRKTVLFVTHDIDEAVYLADRVIALGGKPGEVKASVVIDVPRPRSRSDAALQSYAEKVKAELIAEAAARDDWVI